VNVTVRRATRADRDALAGLSAEWPANVDDALSEGAAFLAETEGLPAGFALVVERRPGAAYLSDLYVRPDVRERGVGHALLSQVAAWAAERGDEVVGLTVEADNAEGRRLYETLGFRVDSLNLTAGTEALAAALAERTAAESLGSVHVQSDDLAGVERAAREFVPRLPGRSRGSVVVPPRDGWVAVYDELCDREPEMLRRLARELSSRLGAVVVALGVERSAVVRYVLYEGGRVVDEYLSVPEFYGPLPPGDVVALAANPSVARRLTGADPAALKEAARTASSPADLPPARELAARVAAVLGLGAFRGFAEARQLPDAVEIERP
jgi:GNAT superfamily N-acetyltransferase